MSKQPGRRWVRIDELCQRGPRGVVVHRWQVFEDSGYDDTEVYVWKYQAWHHGEVGPVRDDVNVAFDDAEHMVTWRR